jgi:hypothetical protein
VTDWTTVASLGTAAGTLVLAAATFSSVRSSNRTARVAEASLLAEVRPLLIPSRHDDPPLKVDFADNHWVYVDGGAGAIEVTDDAVYLAMSLRNAGTGLAVLHGWRVDPAEFPGPTDRPAVETFRRLTRDIYLPVGDNYFWQGTIREAGDPDRDLLQRRLKGHERIAVDLLYGDQHGGQRMVSRFGLTPGMDSTFLVSLLRQWNVDRPDPR